MDNFSLTDPSRRVLTLAIQIVEDGPQSPSLQRDLDSMRALLDGEETIRVDYVGHRAMALVLTHMMKAALATEDQSRPSLDVGVRAFRDVFALAQLADANTLALAVASACIQLVHEPANTMRDCCRQYSF